MNLGNTKGVKVQHTRSGRTGVVVRVECDGEWVYPIVQWDDDKTLSNDQHLDLVITNLSAIQSRGWFQLQAKLFLLAEKYRRQSERVAEVGTGLVSATLDLCAREIEELLKESKGEK